MRTFVTLLAVSLVGLAVMSPATQAGAGEQSCGTIPGPRGYRAALFVYDVTCSKARGIARRGYKGQKTRGWKCRRYDEYRSGRKESMKCSAKRFRYVRTSPLYTDEFE